MTLKEQLKEIEKWDIESKSIFFEKIGESIPIGVRLLVERDDLSAEQKNNAFRQLSEFHHEMNKIKGSVKSIVGFKFEIDEIGKSLALRA